jgi:hypothetical protein
MSQRVITVEEIIPPITMTPMGIRISANEAPIPNAMGIIPRMMAMLLIKMGLSFAGHALIRAS